MIVINNYNETNAGNYQQLYDHFQIRSKQRVKKVVKITECSFLIFLFA